MKGVSAMLGILALLALAACSKSESAPEPPAPAPVSVAAVAAMPSEPGLFVATDDGIMGLPTVLPGTTELTLENHGTRPHELQLITILDQHIGEDLVGIIAADPSAPLPSWAQPIGGTGPVQPGDTAVAQAPVMGAGNYAVASLLATDVGVGFILPITAEDTEPTSTAAPGSSWKVFRMPSDDVGCAFYGAGLRCDILSGMNPEPSGECSVDWTGLGLQSDGLPAPVCAGDTVYDVEAPVLAYGETWGREGIVCQSKPSGLACTNASGHGFTLARDEWTTT